MFSNTKIRRANGEITHIRVQRTNDGFDLGERQECFSTLYDMIEHYRQNVGELREKNNEIIELTVPILAQMPTFEKYSNGLILLILYRITVFSILSWSNISFSNRINSQYFESSWSLSRT